MNTVVYCTLRSFYFPRAIAVLAFLFSPLSFSASTAQETEDDPSALVDAFTTALYQRLASRREALLLDAAADNAVALGGIYLYKTPKCDVQASDFIDKGTPISLTEYRTHERIDVPDQVRISTEAPKSGRYFMTNDLSAQLAAKVQQPASDAGLSVAALTKSLQSSQIHFQVVRKALDFDYVVEKLEPLKLKNKELPPEYEGLLVILAQLTIVDFTYTQLTRKDQTGGADISLINKLLGAISAKFSAEKAHVNNGTVNGSETFAVKGFVARAKHGQTCSP